MLGVFPIAALGSEVRPILIEPFQSFNFRLLMGQFINRILYCQPRRSPATRLSSHLGSTAQNDLHTPIQAAYVERPF